MKHPKNKFTKAKSRQVLLRQIQEICMLDNDINMLKMTICAKAGSNKMEVEQTKRLVSNTAHYIMDCYQEVERQLEDMEAGQVLRHLDPSINSTIFKNIEGMEVEKLEETMNIYAELMIDETQPEKELLKLIMIYRYMLKRIIKEANNIEIIKIGLQNKIWEQLESNKDQKEVYPKTGSQVREKQHEGEDRLEHNLVPHKLDSGQPTLNKGLAQGPKTSQEGLLLNGGFQESTEKDALLGKNLKDDKKGLKCSIPGCDFKTTATKRQKDRSENMKRNTGKKKLDLVLITQYMILIIRHQRMTMVMTVITRHQTVKLTV